MGHTARLGGWSIYSACRPYVRLGLFSGIARGAEQTFSMYAAANLFAAADAWRWFLRRKTQIIGLAGRQRSRGRDSPSVSRQLRPLRGVARGLCWVVVPKRESKPPPRTTAQTAPVLAGSHCRPRWRCCFFRGLCRHTRHPNPLGCALSLTSP